MVPVTGAALIRVATYPPDLVLPAWPDLTCDEPEQWRSWLGAVWALPDFRTAVTYAAPALAAQITRIGNGEHVTRRRLRRLVASTLRYVLRWTTRATPFGGFAGVAPVQFGPHAAVRVGSAHRVVSRPDGDAAAEQATRAERDMKVLAAARVVTTSLGYQRGDRGVLPCAESDGERRFDREIRLTRPIRTVIDAARSPIGFGTLTAKLATPGAAADAERLLAGLVKAGVLLSDLRPSTTSVLPSYQMARPDAPPPVSGDGVAVDVRADVSITVPPAVLHEVGRAAKMLAAVAPRLPGWQEYHRAFIERWGPGAAVPVHDVLNVLGFPAGYRGSKRRDTAPFTARDTVLGQLAQTSALRGGTEVVLDEDLISRLRDGDDRLPMPHTELRFALAADTEQDVDRGRFTMTVLSGARHAGVSAARFLHLLDGTEADAFRRVYRQLPPARPGADMVQLSGPPLDARLTAVARTPELLPILPVGDFHPPPPYTVDYLAVTGDGSQLWLVSRVSGRTVEPLLLNSVWLSSLQQPLMRFLTEIWTAWRAPCTRFDWGHVRNLPFLPRIRYGRTILHPARWIIERADLPARTTPWAQWYDAWQRYQQQQHIPHLVLAGTDDILLGLDLNHRTQLAVLRDQLDRQPQITVTEAPGPAGWINGRPAEILLTLTHPTSSPEPARQIRPASTHVHRPGTSRWLEARLYGRADDILTDLADRHADHLPPGWWFLRYPDPESHLRLRVPLTNAGQFPAIASWLAQWASELHSSGTAHDYSLHPYRPETRHGTAATLAAAEAVFAADSAAALTRLSSPDRQAVTAAGMIAIADAFTGDGPSWLQRHVPQKTGPRLNPPQLELARRPVRDERLSTAVTAYKSFVEQDGHDSNEVLADLLHLHHARMIGVDLASEHHCLRLARTVARSSHLRQKT